MSFLSTPVRSKYTTKIKWVLEKKCTSRCWESALSRHAPHPKEKQLLVFVSFSLGKEILRTLFDEVDKRGGRLILRGLKNTSKPFSDNKSIPLSGLLAGSPFANPVLAYPTFADSPLASPSLASPTFTNPSPANTQLTTTQIFAH